MNLYYFYFHRNCVCLTCAFAGGPQSSGKKVLSQHLCPECKFNELLDMLLKLFDNGNLEMQMCPTSGDDDDDFYHLSWAVFKHLKSKINLYR